ncbi:MAG TPA: hypothetical protein VKS79_09680 [Gemmataceae bacterium]|nr:hypothetical protein [Gemmataceae bacterium]
MPNILSDPPSWLYGLLAVVVVVPLLVAVFFTGKAQSTRASDKKTASPRTKLFAVAGVGLLLLLALGLCDYLFESDREQVVRKLKEMSEGVQHRDLNRVFNNVSESFQWHNAKKADLRKLADSALNSGQVTELKIWNVQLKPVESGATKANVEFNFKVEGSFNNSAFYLCKATFVKDPDGQWRLQTFDVFNPAVDTNTPITVPGM